MQANPTESGNPKEGKDGTEEKKGNRETPADSPFMKMTVQGIGYKAFAKCSALQTIHLSEGLVHDCL